MSISVKLSVGLTNYTNYLLVVARPVDAPSVEATRQSFGPAPSSVNIDFNLDPKTYYFDFRDSPDGVQLGNLRATYVVDALGLQTISEKRFYTVDGIGPNDPTDNTNTITDPYFLLPEVNVFGVFKEAFRDLEPALEWSISGDTITIPGQTLYKGEKVVVDIHYKGVVNTTSGSGGFVGVKTITTDTVLDATYYDNRIRLRSSSSKLLVTLNDLATVPTGTQYYFMGSGGSHKQARIITQGADRIYWDSFITPQLPEIWCAAGQYVWLEVSEIDGSKYYEVIGASSAIAEVGQRLSADCVHKNTLLENIQLIDGDEYPALWWWVNNILPATQKATDDNILSGSYTGFESPAGKYYRPGIFVLHSSQKKMRLPNTQGLSEKNLKSFEAFGSDTTRLYDYPGGLQAQAMMEHGHRLWGDITGASGGVPYALNTPGKSVAGASRLGGYQLQNQPNTPFIEKTGGSENIVTNYGVLKLRKI